MPDLPPLPEPSWLPVIPGPFLLLLFLPLFPLLLFSIGARPPYSGSLPFSTDEIWQTAALVTAAGSVALCALFYPGAAEEVWVWVKGGTLNEEPVSAGQWQMQAGRSAGRTSAHTVQTGRRAASNRRISPPKPVIDLRARQMILLRQGILSKWYSPSRPNLLVVLCLVLLVLLLFFTAGHLIGASFDAEKTTYTAAQIEAGGKKWRKRQLDTRQRYKDDEERIKAEWTKAEKQAEGEMKGHKAEDRPKWTSQREKDKKELAKELEEKKLPVLGLEEYLSTRGDKNRGESSKQDGSGGSRGGDKSKRERKDNDASPRDKDQPGKGSPSRDDEAGDTEADGEKKPAKMGFGQKLKRGILGKNLYNSLEEKKEPRSRVPDKLIAPRSRKLAEVQAGKRRGMR